MVRITRPVLEKHKETMSPWIDEFRSAACATSLPLLPQFLATFPTRWPFPRADLYHWVSLLNRFDIILERFCKTYKLDEGPQTMDFTCQMLETNTDGSQESHDEDLRKLGYGKDGDRQLVESILAFSQTLLQNCSNRSIYASSPHLNSLLNSTSLSILESALHLALELAQRYNAALKRGAVRHASKDLLKNHYNIDLDRVLQLALPFTKTIVTPAESIHSATPVTPNVKGKEKAHFSTPAQKAISSTLSATDLVSFVKGGSGVSSSPKGPGNGSSAGSAASEHSWEQWGDVKVTYYPKPAPDSELPPVKPRSDATSPRLPSFGVGTPTPTRRSNLGPNSRNNRQNSSDGSPTPLARSSTFPTDDTPQSSYTAVEISSSMLASTSLHNLLGENVSGMPQDKQYELLSKLRVASALTTSLETRRQMLSVRLLAITNLAYVHPETTFIDSVLKQDNDEPRRLQLVYQLAELIHPPPEGDVGVPLPLQTLAFSALTAIAEHPSKYNDVCAALNTNVNHGVLLYVVRKAVAGMGSNDDSDNKLTEEDRWRNALFYLLGTSGLSANPRTSGDLVTAGLIPIFVEVLTLRTNIAERYQPEVLKILDTIMYSARDAFQTLVTADGLDVVSSLIVFEVKNAAENAAAGKGTPQELHSLAVDYDIPFYQQQTLRMLFKFIHHMMSTAGGYGGNFDRLLRNLIDSPPLLGSLRQIIGNSHCFGSIVWTNAVSILNDFINNEPTSYAVIAEAGLSKGFLEAVTGTEVVVPSETKKHQAETEDTAEPSAEQSSPAAGSDDDDDDDDDDSSDDEASPQRPSPEKLQAPRQGPLAKGVMPTPETISIVPQAFGAICLNNAGMKMFQQSRALETFFEVFESREHVKCMVTNPELPNTLGGTFDELARHHPPLKTAILNAVIEMVARVGYLCKMDAEKKKIGSKLFALDSSGRVAIADASLVPVMNPGKGKGKAIDDGGDVEMQDAGQEPVQVAPEELSSDNTTPNASNTAYISVVSTFLNAILANSSIRSEFCSRGGIEYVLDLADSPCLYTGFADSHASKNLQSVIGVLAEHKPHLAIPSLLRRAQSATDVLAPFANHADARPFFAPFVNAELSQTVDAEFISKGTTYAKAFVNLHSLLRTLHACFQTATHFTHHRSSSTSFIQINVADYYVRLVRSLGPLLGASIREDILLQNMVPAHWKNNEALVIKDPGFGEPTSENILGTELPSPASETAEPDTSVTSLSTNPVNGDSSAPVANDATKLVGQDKVPAKSEQKNPFFQNYRTINSMLKTRSISTFFQTLGKALVTKRNPDAFQKQSHMAIADALAETMLLQLGRSDNSPSIENLKYWIRLLAVLKEMLVDTSRHAERPTQTITLVLQAFKDRDGFESVNRILETFTREIQSRPPVKAASLDKESVLWFSRIGAGDILSLYSQLVTGKNVTEAQQTVAIATRNERDRTRLDNFSPPQFLVELRMAVLPVARRLWQSSEFIERAPDSTCERLIEVIRIIVGADSEANASRRSDKVVPPAKVPPKTFKISDDHVSALVEGHFYDRELAIEALYRCNNNPTSASEYCREIVQGEGRRNPIPEGDIAPTPDPTEASKPRTGASTGTSTPDSLYQAAATDSRANIPTIVDSLNQIVTPSGNEEPAAPQNFDSLLNQFTQNTEVASRPSSSSTPAPKESPPAVEESTTKQVTVDDLTEEREALREDLIDKCLDVINAHGEVTFEVADLIKTVINKSSDPPGQRKNAGTTLVIALMSFAGEEDLRAIGTKIAAYANLLALMLQDRLFYAETLGDLKENLSTLLSFIRFSDNHTSEDESPWIAQILLVIEMLLCEDARPRKTRWTTPTSEDDTLEGPVLETAEPSVPEAERLELFDKVLDILPRIGKDERLALAVLRILVILTRSRPMAQALSDKKNIQRLFVMAKQLAGVSSSRIQGPLMLILRHCIEDDETIKQVMRAEIKAWFEGPRTQRTVIPSTYLQGLCNTAVRQPELFVVVTNEMVKYNRWQYTPSGETPSRHMSLILKETPVADLSNGASDDSVSPTVQATEDLTIQDVKTSTEGDSEMPDVAKHAAPESKLPVVAHPDGIIHYLLCELITYKDVSDGPAVPAIPTITADKSNAGPSSVDTPMIGASTSEGGSQENKDAKQTPKQEFKSEEHPMYIHRCFILQCLTELLASYNSTKVEFINWHKHKPVKAMTPSKPRSTAVNYLLYDLLPIGTLDHPETIDLRKQLVTSGWADSVLCALVTKTGERPVDAKREQQYDIDDEPDLLHVRKYVLENILRAFGQASASTEPLDVKYARMLALSDLMSHIMSGKENAPPAEVNLANVSQKQLRRIMYEKGFMTALTQSIAEIDLNFPGARRAVKYILRPLKTLSSTALVLSELGLISTTPDHNDADEIESASSASEIEDDREETPDLFRNSTLGMFEPGREGDSSDDSEDDDEEMYEGEYDDEMEYEEDIGDGEENVSDEDEEVEGMGPMEGLSGDHGLDVEVIMEDDDGEDDDEGESNSDDDSADSGSDLEDDDARVEIIDEAGNVQELNEDDMEDWESDDQDDEGEEEDYEGQAADQEEQELHEMNAMDMASGPLSHLVRALGGEDAEDMIEQMEQQMEADGIDPGDDEDRIAGEYIEEDDNDVDDDDDDDDADEDDILFEGNYPLDGPGRVPFGWEGEVEPAMGGLRRHPRPGGFPPFPFFPGGRDPLGGELPEHLPPQILAVFQQLELELADLTRSTLHMENMVRDISANLLPVPSYGRSHRPGAPARSGGNDGINPLLQRNNSAPIRDIASGRHTLGSFIQGIGGPNEILDIGISGRPFGEAERALFQEAMRSLPVIPGTIARHGQALQFHITTGPGHELPRDIQAMFGMRAGPRYDGRHATDPGNSAFFTPQSTKSRWDEEAKLLFGPTVAEKAADLYNAIQAVLVPPAIEADKAIKAAEAEEKRKLEEEAKKKAEEERIIREAKEAEEKAEKEKKEAEEQETAERAAAEALAARGPESEQEANPVQEEAAEAMEGIETENAETAPEGEGTHAEETPAADRPRVTTVIRGNPYDITDLGIDPEFLAELPEEIREEVIMSAVSERRSAAAATGTQPSDIEQEFLDALPADIREEIMAQERQDRRRREREERNRQATVANGGAPSAGEMDAASILATLPPALRQQVLMEQDEDMLALLPSDIADQARAAQRDHPAHQGRVPGGFARRAAPPVVGQDAIAERQPRRAVVQMLDKPGIATLLRLMFIFQQGSLRNTLNTVLQNISHNRQNRNEVLGTILHILQDGSFDMSAVERSFAQLSLRAKQALLKEKDPKTPTPLKRTLTSLSTVSSVTPTNFEASPLMVVQQCLLSLVFLTSANPHIPAFFLTEHEPTGGLKRSLSRKGKGKENKASRYPLNSLLTLLDRELIMESSSVMESLSTLLNMTTYPLQALQRRQKEAAEEAKKEETADAAPTADTAGSGTTPETATSNVQLSEAQPDAEVPDSLAHAEPTPVQPSNEGAEPSTSTETPTAPAESNSIEAAKEPEKKSQRQMVPPIVPEHNLQLVINIFVARECSSKTFRETLSTIKNLSAIPDAKAVFGRELISKAQGLGEIILVDLQDLLPQIEKATTGTEIQGVALAKFSPGGSDQNKLLRVLTALDHLFDPKRDKKDASEADSEGESSQLSEKQDLLSSLYENSTFGPMWEKLSECLRAIRQREHMLNVATILLPLIEALMVVCKNTTLKEKSSQISKEMLLTSPPPESRMESLFFTFTEEHRKILNDLVRHTPKLMSGTFSLLVKNPKVLEFDNKRNYFTRSIHAKAPNGRQSHPPLQLSVRRDQVFHDSFKSLYFQTGDQMKYGKLSIRFHGEEGVDAGGVTREWFQVLSRQMFDPGYALFIPVSSDRTTFHPNQLSSINEEHLMFFKFIGRIIGKALYEGRVLDCHFSRAVYKRILGKPVSVKDMESLDPEYYKSLVWMLENDITDIITETFSVDNDKFGVVETIDFIENGRNIPVTEENKHEYIRLMVEWKLTGSVKEQLDEFLKGFHDIIPAELIAIFNEQELELLISGLPEIEVDDWKSNTEYHNYTASSPQIQWFWRAIRSYDKEERAKLLQFVTGTSKVPLNGFRELEGMNGFSRFNIHRDYGSKERLPSSHTCFNQLDLPEYESYESLRSHVLTAITAGSEYFGFA
ncbi:E3 ubiquitin-protein ligase [Lachnellula occidentalis]|uniref:HECT-type E3 ubiquitin transferase n=1 Tax=Lachnellula occidentalis TaxID=215460 RepID=A0A8H8U9Z5_9HELO|nr:E3 ubiquitin-protein ligase [Lachnellula occidentalis]